MRPIADEKLDEIETLALESVRKIREYFKYEGNDARYFQKAKMGATVISGYARLRASETNRMAVELMRDRELPSAEAPRLMKAR